MGKLSLLTAALARGHLALVVITMINAAIAVYYYLCVIRIAVFGDAKDNIEPLALDWPTRTLCVLLIAAIVALGVHPAPVFDAISNSIACVNLPLPGR